jgi:hypothetical protein
MIIHYVSNPKVFVTLAIWVLISFTVFADDNALAKCVESLKLCGDAHSNYTITYAVMRKDGSGVEGTVRSAGKKIQSEFQHSDDPLKVAVFRGDAYFMLEREGDNWIPTKLDPAPRVSDSVGPTPFRWGYHYFEAPFSDLLMLPKDHAHNGLRFVSFSRSASGLEWIAKFTHDRIPGYSCRVVFLESNRWLCDRIYEESPKFSIERQMRYEGEIHGFPFLSEIREYSNGSQSETTTLKLVSDQAPSSAVFRLDHYGLSESLLRLPSDGWSITQVSSLTFAIGVVLVAISLWMGISKNREK